MIYQLNLSFSLSLLFTGFLLANIFGIITNSKTIVFFFVLGIELINYFIYSNLQKASFINFLAKHSLSKKTLTASDKGKANDRIENSNRSSFLNIFDSLFSPFSLKSYENSLKKMDKHMKHRSSIVVSTAATSLNFLKIGFEFGFFVDAFKLGS